MFVRISSISLVISSLLLSCVLIVSCHIKNDTTQSLADEKLAKGKLLVNKYCGSCHLAPNPSLLDKETWSNHVLPAMAKQLGLEVWQGNHYYQNERSAISQADWTQIIAYYDSLAPEHLSVPKSPVPLVKEWSAFSLKKPESNILKTAVTTMVTADSSTHSIYTSDSKQAGLYQWSNNLKQSGFTQLPSPAVQMSFQKDGSSFLTCIGEMKAIDNPAGKIIISSVLNGKNSLQTVTSNLFRPINTVSGDFNKDGLTDYIVSSFGHNKGGLFLVKQLPDHTFQNFPIRGVSGATQSIVQDFNQDGWPDIMTLFAHGDEGIWLFLNDRKGGFSTENILRFPPVYGSSSFQLVDMNKDGTADIVYTAGDNSDYSRILKPYHGLYIFTGLGNLKFKQTYFYPINGCTKAIAADMDQDGDMDITTIAFFADLLNKPEESFIYFEQNNSLPKAVFTFKPYAIPVHSNGRWICMDVNDYDGDGDKDIVLGNYSKGFLNQKNLKPNWDVHVPFVVLKNNIR